jgi:TolB-like protein
MDAVWPGTAVAENNLTVQISSLRRVLDDERAQGSCIQTVPGRGYRFVAAVTREEPRASDVSSLPLDDVPAMRAAANRVTKDSEAPIGPVYKSMLAWFYGGRRSLVSIAALTLSLIVAVGSSSTEPRQSETHQSARPLMMVRPFANLGNDPRQQSLADDLTADLKTDLSQVADGIVISEPDKGRGDITAQAGGARYILENSIERIDEQIRVNSRLIDVKTNEQVWAELFDYKIDDLLKVQDDITGHITTNINAALIKLRAAQPVEQVAAPFYIAQGRAITLKPSSRENYAMEIRLFEQALALDPQSSEAMSRLALAYVGRVLDNFSDTKRSDLGRARELVSQARALSPGAPLTHLAEGQRLRAEGHCDNAVLEYEAALAVVRNWVGAISHMGRCKTYLGQIDEGIRLQERAARLGPGDPFIGFIHFRLGEALLLQSHNDGAISWLEKARVAQPSLGFVHAYLAAAYSLKDNAERATAELAEAKARGKYRSLAAERTGLHNIIGDEPDVLASFESTYIAGLRKAGLPERLSGQ